MQIQDRIEYKAKKKPVCMKQTDSAREAINIMKENNFGAIVVTEQDDTILGIVTERDLLNKLLFNKMNPDKTKLSEIMTKDVKVAKPEDKVVDWLRIMSNERFRHVPIVNDNDQVICMMSQGDFVSYTWPELLETIKVRAKDTLGRGYQIVIIILALLVYAFLVNLFVK